MHCIFVRRCLAFLSSRLQVNLLTGAPDDFVVDEPLDLVQDRVSREVRLQTGAVQKSASIFA